MTFDGRTLTTLIMVVLFAGACLLSLSLPSKAAFMPLLIGVPGTILCLAQLVIDLRQPRPETETKTGAGNAADEGRSELEVFAWFALFAAAIIGFGFILGAPIVVFAFTRFFSHESWRNAAFAGVGTLAVTYGVFAWLLELTLFPGLVVDWLG